MRRHDQNRLNWRPAPQLKPGHEAATVGSRAEAMHGINPQQD